MCDPPRAPPRSPYYPGAPYGYGGGAPAPHPGLYPPQGYPHPVCLCPLPGPQAHMRICPLPAHPPLLAPGTRMYGYVWVAFAQATQSFGRFGGWGCNVTHPICLAAFAAADPWLRECPRGRGPLGLILAHPTPAGCLQIAARSGWWQIKCCCDPLSSHAPPSPFPAGPVGCRRPVGRRPVRAPRLRRRLARSPSRPVGLGAGNPPSHSISCQCKIGLIVKIFGINAHV